MIDFQYHLLNLLFVHLHHSVPLQLHCWSQLPSRQREVFRGDHKLMHLKNRCMCENPGQNMNHLPSEHWKLLSG